MDSSGDLKIAVKQHSRTRSDAIGAESVLVRAPSIGIASAIWLVPCLPRSPSAIGQMARRTQNRRQMLSHQSGSKTRSSVPGCERPLCPASNRESGWSALRPKIGRLMPHRIIPKAAIRSAAVCYVRYWVASGHRPPRNDFVAGTRAALVAFAVRTRTGVRANHEHFF